MCVTVSDAGLLGAALVYVLQLGGLFQWAVRQSAEVRFPRLVYVRKTKTPPVEVHAAFLYFSVAWRPRSDILRSASQPGAGCIAYSNRKYLLRVGKLLECPVVEVYSCPWAPSAKGKRADRIPNCCRAQTRTVHSCFLCRRSGTAFFSASHGRFKHFAVLSI